MNWNQITTIEELDAALIKSAESPVLLFKHSTSCSISSAALHRLERKWEPATDQIVSAFYIDLLRYRQISNAIAKHTGIQHESPQSIIFHKGKVLYEASHNGIDYSDMLESLRAA